MAPRHRDITRGQTGAIPWQEHPTTHPRRPRAAGPNTHETTHPAASSGRVRFSPGGKPRAAAIPVRWSGRGARRRGERPQCRGVRNHGRAAGWLGHAGAAAPPPATSEVGRVKRTGERMDCAEARFSALGENVGPGQMPSTQTIKAAMARRSPKKFTPAHPGRAGRARPKTGRRRRG